MRILPDGVYVLDYPIKNPRRDRRSNAWAKGGQLPAGTYKVVGGPKGYVEKYGSYQNIYVDDARYQVLAEHLKPKTTINLRDVVNEGSSSGDAVTILIALVAIGRISFDDVRAAIAHLDTLDIKGVSEMLSKHGYSQ